MTLAFIAYRTRPAFDQPTDALRSPTPIAATPPTVIAAGGWSAAQDLLTAPNGPAGCSAFPAIAEN